MSKLRAPSDTEPSTNSSADSSPWLTRDKNSPEWNSEPVGLKFESIENFRIVFVTFSLFWKQKLPKSGERTTEIFYFNWTYAETELTVPKTSLTSTDANSHESDGKLPKKKEIESVSI